MTFAEIMHEQSFIPPEPEEPKRKEVKVVCTVFTYLDVPADLENYSDIKEWIEEHYTTSEILEEPYRIYIEDIEK